MAVLSLRNRALAVLTRREHSRSELERKLAPHASDGAELEALLDALERDKLLSEARFAESLVQRRQARYGNQRIARELQQHQLAPDLVAEHLRQLTQSEAIRCRAVWSKRFGQLPQNLEERARQSRFLAARGFGGRCIDQVLKGSVSD